MYFQTLRTAFKICLFKGGPHEMPKSWPVLSVLIPIFYLGSFFTSLPAIMNSPNYQLLARSDLILTIMHLIIFYGFLFLILGARKVVSRFLQTAVAITAIIVLMYLVVLALSLLGIAWVNIMAWISGNFILYFDLKTFEALFMTGGIFFTPFIYLVIFPRVFQLCLSTTYPRAFIVNLFFLLVTFSVEGNLARMITTPVK